MNNTGGVFGLDGATSVAVSPDGYHVFVAGQVDDSLAVFSRTASTDDLQFVDLEQNMVAGVTGLNGAGAVAVSPAGDRIYVASRVDNALAVFGRDGTADDLTFLSSFHDGLGGVDGLERASAVAVSPDGRHIYVTGRVDDSVAVFERPARRPGRPGGRADSLHVYAAARQSDSVVGFRLLEMLFYDDFESGDTTPWSSSSP